MRRRDSGTGCGARGRGSQPRTRAAPGLRPPGHYEPAARSSLTERRKCLPRSAARSRLSSQGRRRRSPRWSAGRRARSSTARAAPHERGVGCAFRRSAPSHRAGCFRSADRKRGNNDQPARHTGRGRCRHAASEVAPRRANIFKRWNAAASPGSATRPKPANPDAKSLSSDTPLRSSPRRRPVRRLPSACRERAGGRIRAPRPSRPACRCRCDGRDLPATGCRCAPDP